MCACLLIIWLVKILVSNNFFGQCIGSIQLKAERQSHASTKRALERVEEEVKKLKLSQTFWLFFLASAEIISDVCCY